MMKNQQQEDRAETIAGFTFSELKAEVERREQVEQQRIEMERRRRLLFVCSNINAIVDATPKCNHTSAQQRDLTGSCKRCTVLNVQHLVGDLGTDYTVDDLLNDGVDFHLEMSQHTLQRDGNFH